VRFVQPGKRGDVVAVQTQYGGIYAWRIGDQKQLLAVDPSEARQGLLCLSPDETRVAYLQDNTLVVQSLVYPDETHSYDLGFEPLVAGYCDANGRLALADDETGWIMDLEGNELTTLDNSVGLLHGFTFAFSPDGRYLLGRTAQRLFVWDAGTGKVVQRVALKRGDEVREVVFAPDSSTAALEYGDGADLINLATGDVTAFPMPEGRSFVLRFSPDGQYIVTAAQVDTSLTQTRNYRLGELAIWDAATLKPIRTIQGGGPLTGLDIRADGMQIVTASPSGELVVWGLPAR
jgi:WD40 repeat protein